MFFYIDRWAFCSLGPPRPGPVLQHTISCVADGVPWPYSFMGVYASHVHHEHYNPHPLDGVPVQAPAKVVAEKSNAMAEEFGPGFAQRSLGTRGRSFKNASRQYKLLVKKFNLKLKVPISWKVHEEAAKTSRLPLLKLSDMVKTLLADYPWVLLGGCSIEKSPELLLEFWQSYKKQHPEHAVFEYDLERLSKTIPITFHGDGGRTQKKEPIEVCSFQPVLGLETSNSSLLHCQCSTSESFGGGCLANSDAQRVNSKQNSYLHHFLCFAYPSKRHRNMPGLLRQMIEEVMTDCASACREGVVMANGQKFFLAVLGIKADMEWAAKIGCLDRSYQNVGHKNNLPCCHECLAGGDNFAFEDCNRGAAWENTRFQSLPWSTAPPWQSVPFDDTRKPLFLRRDNFHIFRLGVARNYLASCILLMGSMGLFDEGVAGESCSVGARLERAYGSLRLFCQVQKLGLRLRGFTIQNFHQGPNQAFPYVGSKGSDTIIIMKWLLFFARLQLEVQSSLTPKDREVLVWVSAGSRAGLTWGQGLHGHGLWLKQGCVRHLRQANHRFCSSYCFLAQHCLEGGVSLFGMVPKFHALCHFRLEFDDSIAAKLDRTLNPACFDNACSEDFIGKIAKQSRRVSYKCIETALLLAYCVKAKFVNDNFSKNRAP